MIEIQEIEEKARKRKYICPSLEIHYSEEDDWIICDSVTIEGGDQGGEKGDEGYNEELESKYNPFSSSMFTDDDFDEEDFY